MVRGFYTTITYGCPYNNRYADSQNADKYEEKTGPCFWGPVFIVRESVICENMLHVIIKNYFNDSTFINYNLF